MLKRENPDEPEGSRGAAAPALGHPRAHPGAGGDRCVGCVCLASPGDRPGDRRSPRGRSPRLGRPHLRRPRRLRRAAQGRGRVLEHEPRRDAEGGPELRGSARSHEALRHPRRRERWCSYVPRADLETFVIDQQKGNPGTSPSRRRPKGPSYYPIVATLQGNTNRVGNDIGVERPARRDDQGPRFGPHDPRRARSTKVSRR